MDINNDISAISQKYWSSNQTQFDIGVVSRIYNEQMLQFGFAHKQIQNLEFTQYFEKYLWPNFRPDSENDFILSICAIINEKLAEKINAWDTISSNPDNFPALFQRVLEMILSRRNPNESIDNLSELKKFMLEKIVLIQFLNNNLLALTEITFVFEEIKHLLSMGMWMSLTDKRLERELAKSTDYRKKFNRLLKADKKTDDKVKYKRDFLPKLIDYFLEILDDNGESGVFDELVIRLVENCLVLFINLDSALVSRRYFNAVIDDKRAIVRAQNSPLLKLSSDSRLFHQLLEMLDFYVNFELDEISGSTVTEMELEVRHQERLLTLQKTAYALFRDPMKEICLSNLGWLEKPENLVRVLTDQPEDRLQVLASELQILPKSNCDKYSKDDIVKMFAYYYKKRPSTLNRINNLALYPTEELIYDENSIPEGVYSVEENFAVPKLSVQYLSFHDYLMRNFDLFRLEATYEIKQDIEQCLGMMQPVLGEQGDVLFHGWCRMALAITGFQIVEIGQPEIGRNHPRSVRADVSVVVNTAEHIRREWENMSRHDPCFLITVCPRLSIDQSATSYHNRDSMAAQAGLVCVRGCEIEGLLDPADNKLIAEEDKPAKLRAMSGLTRTWRVKLDPVQYHLDMSSAPDSNIYGSFNIFLRRKPKENNFKAVLETIRDLMNDHCVVPDWLQDLLLGYDRPSAAHYSAMGSAYIESQDWSDTFLDERHLADSFPQYSISQSSQSITGPPYRLKFPAGCSDPSLVPIEMHDKTPTIDAAADRPVIQVESYRPAIRLAQKFIDPRRFELFESLAGLATESPGNQIRFTATQAEAIRSGMQPGLTLVIGPPGTGKTDVATQIINNLYRNYPNQRTLIVTHSNQALNQLFEKIINLGIDERHLLRLGHGEEALETTKDFSKYGRVNYVLAKRLELLREVERLSRCVGVLATGADQSDEPIYTCETAQHFLLSEVMPRWTAFIGAVDTLGDSDYDPAAVTAAFPFLGFFIPAPFQTPDAVRELFPGASIGRDLEVARACFRHILDMFIVLDDFRSFELMRNGLSRANSLLVQHARIVAMTCTHAALRRRDLIQLGFTYDNILIEEAAQILEIETFIPLLLQQPDQSNLNRLKRWVMIGDHNQLPPVIKNMVFQNYCNLSQSMFARLVKLGVPAIQLNAQGRSRPSLRRLYGWRYQTLEELPVITASARYRLANPGLLFEYQLIDVADLHGVGESEPTPHFLQNLAEAEYSVALYMYLRALHYPAASITILTTYNGQKHLIRDIVRQRCSAPHIGFPSKITTVDRFQGQQNDFVILSLVRTKTVGHLRDVRRLVVALSRARFGLYVLCRTSLFGQCRELRQSFAVLMERPTDLALVSGEHYSYLERALAANGNESTMRTVDDPVDKDKISYIKDVQHMLHYIDTIYSSFKSVPVKRQSDSIDRSTEREVDNKRRKID